MNAITHPTASLSLEREQIRALIEALRKQDHWLDKAEYWQRASVVRTVDGPRQYANCRDRAEECRVEVLGAAYRLLEIDGLHDAFIEAGGS